VDFAKFPSTAKSIEKRAEVSETGCCHGV
jgi:hypothetical protein